MSALVHAEYGNLNKKNVDKPRVMPYCVTLASFELNLMVAFWLALCSALTVSLTSPSGLPQRGRRWCGGPPRDWWERRNMNYGTVRWGHFRTEEPGTRGCRGFSGNRKGGWGWIKADLSACHNIRLLWRGTRLVRMAWSCTVADPPKVGLWTHICAWGVWRSWSYANDFALS